MGRPAAGCLTPFTGKSDISTSSGWSRSWAGRPGLQYDVFQPGGTHLFELTDPQVAQRSPTYERMFAEIGSEYVHTKKFAKPNSCAYICNRLVS